ncbi:aromatic-ring-hydroxylating dioxygenase subunit beta [Thalassovita taeanensis]|uniref:3-phenylpropionate/cinnamic acid dioxygenase, small subunit n=1 Tax=Thalassovita taeanensis TaxID=657014 RepID=A0A1H9HAI1_9RHOB|nr:aromatic-ring-hydroxylating dioxygenase subunit beta [Thalassovita taeanensis]SEQ59247.1 3-phenylpropionate/cinnamic acid dioxygenase, small subunit [Thalassovita taeanensis]
MTTEQEAIAGPEILKAWIGADRVFEKKFDPELYHEVSQFIFREARLQDIHDYDAWEDLWTDDALYWVPANGTDIDPETQMSMVYDNRSRIALRVRQLKTGRRHSQTPPSQLARIISNFEFLKSATDDIKVVCNAQIFETNLRGDTMWAARNEYTLRRVDGALKMAYKKVVLVNNNKAIYTLSFLV